MASKNVNEAARSMSHGRGGAGNMSKERRDSTTKREDLITPTLKAEHYTTGRGGTGNMAKNDRTKPEIARAAQDVEGPPLREPEGNFHYGRGGAANVVNSAAEQSKPTKGIAQVEGKEEDSRGLGEKGKGLLERIVGKK